MRTPTWLREQIAVAGTNAAPGAVAKLTDEVLHRDATLVRLLDGELTTADVADRLAA